MAASKGSGVIGAGSAALRKVIANPLARRGREPHDMLHGEGGNFHSERGDIRDPGTGTAWSEDSVNAIIEGEIIPRLLMAHAAGSDQPAPTGKAGIDPVDAGRFADLPLQLEAADLLEEVDAFLDGGVSVEAVYLDLLAPAARRLGDMWNNDECDFIDVTMGLWRLQEVMREIASRTPVKRNAPPGDASRVLFASMPGDQHSFGTQMIEEVFVRAGWDSALLTKPLRKEVLDALSREPFDLVGLTVSRDCPSSAIGSLVKAMRSVSANPHLSVLVGGQMINQNPAIVAEVGADGTGADARAALEVAERLVQSAPVRAHMLR